MGVDCGACQLASAGCASVQSTDCMRCEVAELLSGAGDRRTMLRGDAPTRRALAIATACMALAALLWGTSFYFIRIALTGFDAVTITFTRCLIGGLVVGTIALGQRAMARRRAALRGDANPCAPRSAAVPISVAAAGLFTALALLGVALGQGTVSSSVAGIVLGTVPVWTAAIVTARTRRRRSPLGSGSHRLLMALILGTVAVALPALGTNTTVTGIGLALLLGAAISHAASMVAVPVGVERLGPILNTSLVMLVAAALLAPLALLHGGRVQPDQAAVLALVEIGLLPTGLAYVAFFRAVAVLGAPRATVAIYLIPLVAVATGTLIGGERLTAGALAGGVCAISALAITVLPQRSRSRSRLRSRRSATAAASGSS